jgi:hypothetical protein
MNPRSTYRLGALALTLAALANPGPAHAEDESPKVRRARYETDLEKSAEAADAVCGTKLTVEIDWTSFDEDARWAGYSVSSFCGAPLDMLARLCAGPRAKAYVAKNVDRLACRAGKSKDDWRLDKKGKVLVWTVPIEASNNDQKAHAELLEKL